MKTFVTLLVAVAVIGSIGCKAPGTSALQPDYRATPTAASFSACPTKDETHGNAPVADVFPDTQKITITNNAKTGSGLKLTISGQDAAAFSVVAPTPTAIGANDSAEVSVAFSPDKRSAFKALLTIDDQFDGTPNVTVDLSGEGKNLPAAPTVEAAPQKADGSAFVTCDPTVYCEAGFPDTLFAKTVTRQLKLRNKGCAALKVTGLAITSNRGDTQGFSIVAPATLPSATSPLLLSTADGTDEITITIAFNPSDDGTGNNSRDAVLTITSNDATNPSTLVALSGQGVKPSAYVVPSKCEFSVASDGCGFATKTSGRAQFRFTNEGNAPLKVASTTFKSTGTQTSGSGDRFKIGTPFSGTTIPVAGSATLEVTYTDAPLYVSDQLEVKITLPDGVTLAGSFTLALFGGSKPCLTTDPLNTVNFNNPTTDESSQTVTIKNGTGCGNLTISSVSVDSSNFFKLGTPVPANTLLAPGASVATSVTYKRPASGGMQVGQLRIESNDSDFGDAKLVQLLSASPLDELPVAELRGCTPMQVTSDATCAMGSTSSMSASLATLGAHTITISGVTSYDPVPGMAGSKRAATKYKFTLLNPMPPNVTGMNLANNDLQITSSTTTLTVTSAAAVYRVGLFVYDDRGQQSSSSTLTVNITQ